MRAFITGATGFVGGALARELSRKHAEVHALVRRGANRDALADVPIVWHEGDITAPETLTDLGSADWVIHAAGMLGRAGVPEETYQRINVDGTRHVLAAVERLAPNARVLHVSSPGVLGPTHGGLAAEDAPLAPSNPYERSKAAAEGVAREFAARRLKLIIARPEFIYGPGDRHVLGLFQTIARGRFFYIDGGRHRCHPTFIDDAVSGMIAAICRGRAGDTYHITGARPVTFRELGDTIASAVGASSPRISLPQWLVMAGAVALGAVARAAGRTPPLTTTGVAFFSEDRTFSWQKAQRELGYRPQFEIALGVARTVEWYRQQGWL